MEISESKWLEIELTTAQQIELRSIGRRMARAGGSDATGLESQPSLIWVDRINEQRAFVRIVDAVGVISIPGLQLSVVSKIPQNHLVYLLEIGGALPRGVSRPVSLQEDERLITLVASWFLSYLERLLTQGLAHDYRPKTGRSSSVRGKIQPLSTAGLFYRGQLAVVTEFEEFDVDTPLNRLLLRAAQLVAAGPIFSDALRRRALRAAANIGPVGPARSGDIRAEPDRRTAHYADAIGLAKAIIESTGRSLSAGPDRGQSFLIRTAQPVEAGLRRIIENSLAGHLTVAKKAVCLRDSTVPVHPDLVFGSISAVGDAKYKLPKSSWDRRDLYEAVAFAAAARTNEALLVGFSLSGSQIQPARLGDIQVRSINWNAEAHLGPTVAAQVFSAQVRGWAADVIDVMGTAGFEPATSRV